MRIQQIKFFTAEASLFVRNLNFFSKIENILINQQVVDLLRDAAITIDALIQNANVIETPTDQRGVIDLIFGFDEHEYCLRRFLECRSCGVSSKSITFLSLAHIERQSNELNRFRGLDFFNQKLMNHRNV